MPPKRITMKPDDIEGDGILDINLGNLPAKVAAMYKKLKDKKINKMEIFRRPLENALVGALDLFTGNSATKFLDNSKYDKLFHLGIIINDKFLFHKQENFNLEKIPRGFKKTKGIELSPVSDFGDITIKNLFRRTRNDMGEKKFYGYDALKNNCQHFVIKSLRSVSAAFDEDFVKQDLKELANNIPVWKQKIGVALTDVARTGKKLIGGGDPNEDEKDKKKKKPPKKRPPTVQERMQKAMEDKHDDDDPAGGLTIDTTHKYGRSAMIGRSVGIK